MRLAGILITACIVLAAAQAVAAALAVALLIAIVVGVFLYPRETFGLLGFCVLAGLVQAQPLACLGIVALLALVRLIRPR